jgi:hypothetical protein
MAGRLKSKRIKRSHYKTDDEFVAALRAVTFSICSRAHECGIMAGVRSDLGSPISHGLRLAHHVDRAQQA